MRPDELTSYSATRADYFKERGYWADETLIGWLVQHVNERPDHTAIIFGDIHLSYRDLFEKARALATGLKGLGLDKGDVIALQLLNVPEYVIAHVAISLLGAVMQTMHMPYRGAEMENLLGHSRARAFICVDAFGDYPTADVVGQARSKLPALEHVIVLGKGVAETSSFAELAATEITELDDPPAPDDPCLLMYTSGTTASPKGVATSYRPFFNNVRLMAGEFAMTPDDVVLSAAPFSHLYGLCTMYLALKVGAAICLLPRFIPADFAATVEAGRATVLFTGPAHNAACLSEGFYDSRDFSSVRFSVISGSVCPPELARVVDEKLVNGRVLQLWGMTEIQAGAYSRLDDSAEARHTSIGRASPGNELRVVGEDGKGVAAGGEGELQISGASVFPGYYNNQRADLLAFDDGWFRTGDLAVIDAQGYLRITGRIKEIINRGGVKFNPLDLEVLVNQMPEVQVSAIVPMPDPVLGEKACVFVQPSGDGKITLEAITNHLEAHQIAKNKWPERLELVDAMPLTPTNKIMKAKLVLPGDA